MATIRITNYGSKLGSMQVVKRKNRIGLFWPASLRLLQLLANSDLAHQPMTPKISRNCEADIA